MTDYTHTLCCTTFVPLFLRYFGDATGPLTRTLQSDAVLPSGTVRPHEGTARSGRIGTESPQGRARGSLERSDER